MNELLDRLENDSDSVTLAVSLSMNCAIKSSEAQGDFAGLNFIPLGHNQTTWALNMPFQDFSKHQISLLGYFDWTIETPAVC